MIREVKRVVDQAIARLRFPFRGVATVLNSDGPVMMVSAEGLNGEDLQGMELFQHYAFNSRPPKGFMYVAVPVGGKTSHAIIIATEHGEYRFKNLENGEAAINTDEGDYIHFKRGRVIDVVTQTLRINAGVKVEITTPELDVTASTKVTFATPEVDMSGVLRVTQTIYGTGGMSISGVPVGGGVSTLTGDWNINSATITYTNCNVTYNGGSIQHNSHNVGDGHKHNVGGVESDGPH